MVSRFCTVGLALALAVWTTGCERHSWTDVSELYRGHHGAHEAHTAEGDKHAESKGSAHGAEHAAPAAKPHAPAAKDAHATPPVAPKAH